MKVLRLAAVATCLSALSVAAHAQITPYRVTPPTRGVEVVPAPATSTNDPFAGPVQVVGSDVVLVLDCSYRDGEAAKLLLGKWVVSDVLDAIPSGVATSVVVSGRLAANSNEAVDIARPLRPMGWADKADLRRYMTQLRQGRVAGLPAALQAVHHMVENRQSQRTIVLICDGEELGQTSVQTELARLAQQDGATLRLVALGTGLSTRSLAAQPFASVHTVRSAQDLQAAVRDVNAALEQVVRPPEIIVRPDERTLPQPHVPPQVPVVDPTVQIQRDAVIQKLTAELMQYKRNLEILTQSQTVVESTATEKAKEVDRMAAEINALKQDVIRKSLAIEKLTSQLLATKPQAGILAKANAQLEVTISQQLERVQTLAAKNEEQRIELDKRHQLIEKQKADIAKLQADRARLIKDNAAANVTIRTQEKQLKTLTNQLEGVAKEMQKLRTQLDDLRNQQATEKDKKAFDLTAALAIARDKIREMTHTIAVGEAAIVARDKQLGEVLRELEAKRHLLDQREAQMQQISAELGACRNELGACQQKVVELNEQLESLQRHSGLPMSPQKIEDLIEQRAAAAARAAELSKQVAVLKAQLESCRQAGYFENNQLKERILHLVEAKNNIDSHLKLIQATLQTRDLEIVSLRKELEARAQEIAMVKELGHKDVLLEGARSRKTPQVNVSVGEGASSVGGRDGQEAPPMIVPQTVIPGGAPGMIPPLGGHAVPPLGSPGQQHGVLPSPSGAGAPELPF